MGGRGFSVVSSSRVGEDAERRTNLLRQPRTPSPLPDHQLAHQIGTNDQKHSHHGPSVILPLARFTEGVNNVEQDFGTSFQTAEGSGEGGVLVWMGFEEGPERAVEEDGEGGLGRATQVDEGVAEFCFVCVCVSTKGVQSSATISAASSILVPTERTSALLSTHPEQPHPTSSYPNNNIPTLSSHSNPVPPLLLLLPLPQPQGQDATPSL